MKDGIKFNLEMLRPLEYIFEPDFRNKMYFTLGDKKGVSRPFSIDDHYEAVSKINLNKSVPEAILVQFETVRNIYLYAWFIYRFYPVAEHQTFACLELALRRRYGKEIPKNYFSRSKEPSLKPLLRYAIDKGDIKNEGFRRWHEAVERRATFCYEMEKQREMEEMGLKQISLDYSEVKIVEVDKNVDYVKILLDTLPNLRNSYAHGSTILHDKVLSTMEIVAEIINQIYLNE